MNSAILKRYFTVYSIITAVLIIIVPAYGQNAVLIADAGRTQTVNAGNIVTLDASNSYDPNRHLSPFPFAQNEDNFRLVYYVLFVRPDLKGYILKNSESWRIQDIFE
jgi:hypothetical protein